MFFLAALLPVLLLALGTYWSVSNELERQNVMTERASAKAIGMDIYERLRFLTQHFNSMVDIEQAVAQGAIFTERTTKQSLNDEFRAFFTVDENNKPSAVHGQAQPLSMSIINKVRQLNGGEKTIVLAGTAVNGNASYPVKNHTLYFFKKIVSSEQSQVIYAAEVDADYLWDVENLAIRQEQVCVLDTKAIPLYCNYPGKSHWLDILKKRIQTKDSGHFEFDLEAGESYRTTFWSIFFAHRFQFPKWVVTVSVPKSVALKPVEDFQHIFTRVMLLAIVLVILLSLRAIKSNLRPLDKLLQMTRQITRRDFGARVELGSQDEFQELGESLNHMASQLGRQFDQLNTLGAIDRQLQQAKTVEAIALSVYSNLNELDDIHSMGLLCLDGDRSEPITWLFPMSSQSLPEMKVVREKLSRDLSSVQTGHEPGGRLIEKFPLLVDMNVDPGAEHFLVPVKRDQTLFGMMLCRIEKNKALHETSILILKQTADVVAIALESVFLGQHLFHQAHHDPLTGLPNRSLVIKEINEGVKRALENDTGGAVILIDLDKFKSVNDM